MSILQDYEKHEQFIGHKKLQALNEYLDQNKELSYDTVIFSKAEWEKFEKWYNSMYGEGAKGDY